MEEYIFPYGFTEPPRGYVEFSRHQNRKYVLSSSRERTRVERQGKIFVEESAFCETASRCESILTTILSSLVVKLEIAQQIRSNRQTGSS